MQKTMMEKNQHFKQKQFAVVCFMSCDIGQEYFYSLER